MEYVVCEKRALGESVIHVVGMCHREQDPGLRSLDTVWSGCYTTLAKAERAAKQTGSRKVRRCRICFPA
ncbi:MAG: hypothetical protein OXG11_07750 [Chloroflexi bacterium]|nr:hypothetical protein [Chloroflexota bacterium]